MPTLLVVHHSASPSMEEMLDAVLSGSRDPDIGGVQVMTRAALAATASDLLAADAVIVGTPANMGYMSGAMKVFFDNCYYPVLRETVGLPFGLYVHGGNDTTGAVTSVMTLATGLKWKAVLPPVTVVGAVSAGDRESLRNLGGTVAVTIASDGGP